jgi:hypothetical protein
VELTGMTVVAHLTEGKNSDVIIAETMKIISLRKDSNP